MITWLDKHARKETRFVKNHGEKVLTKNMYYNLVCTYNCFNCQLNSHKLC